MNSTDNKTEYKFIDGDAYEFNPINNTIYWTNPFGGGDWLEVVPDQEGDLYITDVAGNVFYLDVETKQPKRKEESNSVPLWKRLNGERTTGDWIFRNGDAGNFAELLGGYGSNKTICTFPKRSFVDESESISNATYVQLCVNNFSNVVEALEKCREWFDKHGADYEIGLPNCFIKAKAALSNIS